MASADLHHHSKYSGVSPEWMLKQFGVQESYTEIDTVYRLAKGRGMDFVTLTDHDTIEGALVLKERYPHDAFVSVETTTRFPESEGGGKVHLLIYGLDERQFACIGGLRHDVYRLREYVLGEGLAHSVAHATYDMDGRLDADKLEKLILLFDVFEGLNGTRSRAHNLVWVKVLRCLKPKDIEALHARHGIEPASEDPWVKGFTGGSDDHAGLFIGSGYTVAENASREAFLEAIRDKRSTFGGAHGDYKRMAFSFYKIAHDYAKSTRGRRARGEGLLGIFNEVLFGERALAFTERRKLVRMRAHKDERYRLLAEFFTAYLEASRKQPDMPPEDKVEWLYANVGGLVDALFVHFLRSLDDDLVGGDAFAAVGRIASSLPNALLAAPFLATSHLLGASTGLVHTLERRFLGEPSAHDKRVLWFTDTLDDLNGVSVTLRTFAACAERNGLPLRIVTCGGGDNETPSDPTQSVAANVLELPAAYSYRSELYSAYLLRVPSLLASLELIDAHEPHAVIVSTPGPVGLLGVVAARLLGVPCTGIYHTDFRVQMEHLAGPGLMPVVAERYARWFYGLFDEIRVPTAEYLHILEERGYDRRKMRVFRRGLDLDAFRPDRAARLRTRRDWELEDGFTLLWAGRVSQDKNIEFLAEVYRRAIAREPDVNLVIAGDGPSRPALEEALAGAPRARFLGRLPRRALPSVYAAADLFVFPSDMDTFGMVIFECQACGLPALVSDRGGPKELVRDGETGFVLGLEVDLWVERIVALKRLAIDSPARYRRFAERARAFAAQACDVEGALADVLDAPLETGQPSNVRRRRAQALALDVA